MEKTNPVQDQIMKALDLCYEQAVNGLPKMKNCYELADEYLKKYTDIETASNRFIHWQIAKCSTSGFLTGIGGAITLPVTIPANLSTVWYIQLRMIATIATMAGYDPKDDEVKTVCYICLTGNSVNAVCKNAGIQLANKAALAQLKRLPGTIITKINRAVGFRLVTKFGSKGVINLGKAVPVIGGVVGAGFDFAGTRAAAKYAVKAFVHGNFN